MKIKMVIILIITFHYYWEITLLSNNREAAVGAAARRGPKDKRRLSAPSEGQIIYQNYSLKQTVI